MARSKWISFGVQQPLDRPAKAQAGALPTPSASLPSSPADAKKFGFENFANICYANSVLQTLYFCVPFRDLLLQDAGSTVSANSSPLVAPNSGRPAGRRKLERKVGPNADQSTSSQGSGIPIPSSPPTLYSALQSLFLHIATSPADTGSVAPRAFIDKLKELNELFRSTMHQDAHEFLNYLLNQIVEEIETDGRNFSYARNRKDRSDSIQILGLKPVETTVNSLKSGSSSDASLVHKLFEGVLTSETRCLTCETVSCRDESFLDLSIDIEQNSSLTACLRQFSASEMLCQRNKFFCDSCCDLQEAEKRMKIKKLPNVLALHLKRFKYQEDLGRYIKLTYRVAFPLELRLFNTVDDLDDADRLYNLFAIVVHIGNGPHHGHYISIINTTGSWFVCDDDNVSPIPEGDIPRYFGDSNSGSAYILYYQAVDIDLLNLGLRPPEPAVSAEAIINTIVCDKPRNSTQHSPAVPPGLEAASTSDLLFPSQNSPENSPPTPGLLTIPRSVDSTRQLPPNPTPMTPTSLGRQIMNTIRRAPSMSATRPPSTSAPNGSDRKSLADKSPRLSASPVGFIDASHEVPPVPPLPPNMLTSPPLPSPSTFITSGNEPSKEEKGKEREKSRTSGNWFSKKRKSLRLGDKGGKHESALAQIPPSPVLVAEDGYSQPQHSGWFNRSNSSTGGPKQGTSGTGQSSDVHEPHDPASGRGNSRHGRQKNGLEDFPQLSGSSTPSSTSLVIAGQVSEGCTTIRPLPSMPTTPDHVHPRRNGHVATSLERSRSSVDRKKSSEHNFSFHPISSSPNISNHHPLPPLPFNHVEHQPLLSNGYLPTSEPSPMDKAHHTTEGKGLSPLRHPASNTSLPPVSRSSTLPSTTLNDALDGNSHVHFRSPARNLSLTTPILAFGRKDREREKR